MDSTRFIGLAGIQRYCFFYPTVGSISGPIASAHISATGSPSRFIGKAFFPALFDRIPAESQVAQVGVVAARVNRRSQAGITRTLRIVDIGIGIIATLNYRSSYAIWLRSKTDIFAVGDSDIDVVSITIRVATDVAECTGRNIFSIDSATTT
jgi:hypothetical protein